MGVFSQRPSAYTPPLDGSKAGPTLVGAGAAASPPAESDEQYAAQLGTESLLLDPQYNAYVAPPALANQWAP